jgi:hypothetical protein
MASVETPRSAATSAIELGRGYHVGKQRDALCLAGEIGCRARNIGAVAARGDQLQLALTVVLQKPETDVGHIDHAGADGGSHLVLGELTAFFGHQIDHERGLAHLRAGAQYATAVDEHTPHLRPLPELAGDRLGCGARVGDERAWRQLDGKQ